MTALVSPAAQPAQVALYLTTCSEEHVSEIIDMVRQNPHFNKIHERGQKQIITCIQGAKTNGLKDANQVVKRGKPDGANKRPLNSFLAFRNFYSAALAGVPQKVISKVVVDFWRADPFEAKWAMLAKAYSILRGTREKDDVPLSDFFAICAPMIGVIPAQHYMAIMGWQLELNKTEIDSQEVKAVRSFIPRFEDFPLVVKTTTISVNDLVRFASSMGLGDDNEEEEDAEAFMMAVEPAMTSMQDTAMDNKIFEQCTSQAVVPHGITALMSAAQSIDSSSCITYPGLFDPNIGSGKHGDVSFDPAATDTTVVDGGVFDAYSVEHNNAPGSMASQEVVDMSAFVHDEVEMWDTAVPSIAI